MALSLFNAENNYKHYCNGGDIYGEFSYDNKKVEGGYQNLKFGGSYNTIKFDSNPSDALLDDARLYAEIGPITGSGGTFIRGVNALGIYMFESFSLFQDGKEKEKVYADQIFYNILYNSSAERFSRIASDIGFDTSTANRNTLASSPQTFSIPLKWIFQFFASPINLNQYKEFEIRFTLRQDIRKCLQTDKTNPTFSFLDFYIDRRFVIPFSNQILNTHQELVENGLIQHFDYEYLAKDFQVLQNAVTIDCDLKEFKGKNVQDFMVLLRPKTAVNENNTSDYTDGNLAISSWSLKSGNKFISKYEQEVTSKYYKRIQLPRMAFLGIQNIYLRNEFVVTFSKNYLSSSTDTQMNWSSSKYFGEIGDATLNLKFGALANDSVVTVLARFPKLIKRDKSGNYHSDF